MVDPKAWTIFCEIPRPVPANFGVNRASQFLNKFRFLKLFGSKKVNMCSLLFLEIPIPVSETENLIFPWLDDEVTASQSIEIQITPLLVYLIALEIKLISTC